MRPTLEIVEAPRPAPGPAPPPEPRGWPSPAPVVRRAVIGSRLLVMAVGVFAVLQFGNASDAAGFDRYRLTAPFGYFGNLLVSPLARWDSSWYLAIANWGYGHGQPARTTFFPLYPLMIRGLGFVLRSDLVAGVAVSFCCFAIGLWLLYRLTALELDDERARACVMLIAFCPMAYYFSAVYTESLFLALSVGCIYQARLGRWAWAGALGALAAASRNTGIVLMVPIVLLYLYGPRTDRPPWRRPPGHLVLVSRLRPAFPLELDLGWVLLVPAGLLAYLLFLTLSTGNGLTPFHAEQYWYHHFAGPFGGAWDGAVAAWDGLRQLLHGPAPPIYFKAAGGNPLTVAGQNLMLFGFLVAGVVAFVGVVRRLPFAYAAYALVSLGPALSYPVTPQPLDSLPRYMLVVFPFFMWAAAWVTERHREREVLACFGVLLGLFSAQFATWHFVS